MPCETANETARICPVIAKSCYTFQKKNIFFLPLQFYQKNHSKLLKNQPVYMKPV